MATDVRGHTAPAAGETPKRQSINDLSLSVNDLIMCANATDEASKMAALTPAPTAARPAFTYRQDLDAIRRYNGTGYLTMAATHADAATTSMSLVSGWTQQEAIVVSRAEGWGWMSGVISRDSGTLTVIGAIPVGYRPVQKVRASLHAENSGATDGPVAMMEIATSGDITVTVVSGGPSWTTGTWFWLPTQPWRLA